VIIRSEISFRKYLLLCGTGFGLGGLLWGLVLYRELPNLEFPFHYLAIPIMALCGGVSLALPTKNLKQILKSVLAGFFGWGMGFLVSAVFSYYFYLYGNLLLVPLGYIVKVELLNKFLNLYPEIGIGDLWLVFLVVGIFIGLFHSLFLKIQKRPLMWKASVGIALGSLIGPVVGNLLGNLFNSVLISYLMTFFIMCFIFGWFLGSAIYKET